MQFGRQTGPAAGVESRTKPTLHAVHVGEPGDVLGGVHCVQLVGQTVAVLLVVFVLVDVVFVVLDVVFVSMSNLVT